MSRISAPVQTDFLAALLASTALDFRTAELTQAFREIDSRQFSALSGFVAGLFAVAGALDAPGWRSELDLPVFLDWLERAIPKDVVP